MCEISSYETVTKIASYIKKKIRVEKWDHSEGFCGGIWTRKRLATYETRYYFKRLVTAFYTRDVNVATDQWLSGLIDWKFVALVTNGWEVKRITLYTINLDQSSHISEWCITHTYRYRLLVYCCGICVSFCGILWNKREYRDTWFGRRFVIFIFQVTIHSRLENARNIRVW